MNCHLFGFGSHIHAGSRDERDIRLYIDSQQGPKVRTVNGRCSDDKMQPLTAVAVLQIEPS